MESDRFCPHCELPLESWYHGNRKYHPTCIKEAKNLSNHARYRRIQKMDKLALFLDYLLKTYYPLSNGKAPIDKEMLSAQGFDFNFNTSMTKENDIPLFWILEYGYSYAEDGEKIIIHYGNNPL
jgi:hypothetical protein